MFRRFFLAFKCDRHLHYEKAGTLKNGSFSTASPVSYPVACDVGVFTSKISEKMRRLLGFALFLLVTASLAQAVEETVNVGQVKCGKVNFQCTMKLSFKGDCSKVTRSMPKCTPKKSKCTKGVQVSFVTKSGCAVSGTFKNTGKKQTFSQIKISIEETSQPPPSPLFEETVNLGPVKCGKVTYQQCKMVVSYKDDCSKVSKVLPSCFPKKSKCMKGVTVSFDTQKGCTVTGMYKNTGKKQSMSKLNISTTSLTTTTTTTSDPGCPGGGVASWSDWGEWSKCNSTSSDCAVKFRHRQCINALTSAACNGDPVEIAPCSVEQNSTSPGLPKE